MYKLSFFCFFFIAGITGCRKWAEVPPPQTQVTADGAFADDPAAEATVTGLYSRIMESNLYFLNGAMTVYPALSADELYRTSPNSIVDAFTTNALTAQNTLLSNNLWSKAYAYIYQANACAEGLAAAQTVSEGTKKRLRGEVLFVRALTYFYLANLFGDVPLVLTTDYAVNAKLPRRPAAEVYAQAEADLVEAQGLLSSFPSLPGATRPDAMAATALLGRVYLWEQHWAEAERSADTVISSGAYELEAPDAVFLASSRETIFAFAPVISGVNTAEGFTFIPFSSSALPPYALQDSLLLAFEPGDARKEAWTGRAVVNGKEWWYPYKYKTRSSDEPIENNIVLRLAEMYLLRAEARAQQGKPEEALGDLNVVRARAGLPPLSGLPSAALLAAIGRENRVEFFTEWGHRWLDLKRRNEADTVLAPLKSGWQGTDVLYPIPYSQLLLNSALVQNPGY